MEGRKNKIVTDTAKEDIIKNRIRLRNRFQDASKLNKTMKACCNLPRGDGEEGERRE